MTQPPPISTQLPFDIRAALARASQVSTAIDPLARVKAIDHVLRRAKANQPKYFKE
jgi:hypothetical protein